MARIIGKILPNHIIDLQIKWIYHLMPFLCSFQI